MGDLFDIDLWYKHLFGQLDSNTSLEEKNISDSESVFVGGLDASPTESSRLAVFASLLYRSVAPVVVVAGLIGNLVALFVFSERAMQRRSSNVYLQRSASSGLVFSRV